MIRVLIQVRDEKKVSRDIVAATEVGEDVVERGQDGQLDDQRQAADQSAERVDPVFLVELHHLGVQLLRLFLVLLPQLPHLGRKLSLLDHGLALGDQLELLQRREEQPDEDREDDDRDAVRSDGVEDWNPENM